jgi:hypothetical protein
MPDLVPRRGLGAAAAAPSRGRHRASTAAGSCAAPGEGAPSRIAAPWSRRGGEEGAAGAGGRGGSHRRRGRREPPVRVGREWNERRGLGGRGGRRGFRECDIQNQMKLSSKKHFTNSFSFKSFTQI